MHNGGLRCLDPALLELSKQREGNRGRSAYDDGNVAREDKGDENLTGAPRKGEWQALAALSTKTSPVTNPSAGASRVRNGTRSAIRALSLRGAQEAQPGYWPATHFSGAAPRESLVHRPRPRAGPSGVQ